MVIALSIVIVILIIIFSILLRRERQKNKMLLARKVTASTELIEQVEKEMIKAVKYHNLSKYYAYRKIFNDLLPAERDRRLMY